MRERKWALLAWKFGSSGLFVDEGVVLHDVVGGNTGVYQTIQRGEETINIKHNIKHRNKYTANVKLGGLARHYMLLMKGEHRRNCLSAPVIWQTDEPEGKVPRSIG